MQNNQNNPILPVGGYSQKIENTPLAKIVVGAIGGFCKKNAENPLQWLLEPLDLRARPGSTQPLKFSPLGRPGRARQELVLGLDTCRPCARPGPRTACHGRLYQTRVWLRESRTRAGSPGPGPGQPGSCLYRLPGLASPLNTHNLIIED